ncbi:MAG: hypothetical protein MI924_34705 [Chloroflexales bacterium]|nr:hypothetical protein [Chloroflexales bacterium]
MHCNGTLIVARTDPISVDLQNQRHLRSIGRLIFPADTNLMPISLSLVLYNAHTNAVGTRRLRPHGIDSADTASQVQQGEELRDRGDRVCFGVDRHLAQHEPVHPRPGTDEGQRLLALGPVVRAPMGLAVNRDPVAADLLESMHPGPEPALTLLRSIRATTRPQVS